MIANGKTPPRVMQVGEEPPPLPRVSALIKVDTPNQTITAKAPNPPKTGNRFAVLNAFVDMTMKGLSRSEITVWVLLFRDTKPDGLARTAQTDLARRAGTTTRSIERAVSLLERLGLLSVVHRGGLRKGPSSYRVHALSTPTQLPQPDVGVG
jgi:hypothetical protein